jgi:hypothetical protein
MIVNQGDRLLAGTLLPLFYLFSLLSGTTSHSQQLRPRDFAVELTAEVKVNPPQIVLKWPGDAYARGYTINRKPRATQQWIKIGTAAGHETWFVDRNVSLGVSFEYQVVKEGTLDYMGYGYVYAGIEVPLVEHRGGIILLVESSVAGALEMELKRLEWDLIGDGWKVMRRDVPRSASVTDVKKLIRSLHATDPQNVRSVFLFGNVPVPYSGDLTPDEHDDHKGAWPADIYYGDLDGLWTDHSVTSLGAVRTSNHNRPGDGKFDQSEIPSTVELAVGRVDLSRMTCFQNKSPSRSEIDLLRVYLEKDHAFRHGKLRTDQRALVFDRIGLTKPEPLSTMAWRNFAPFVGGNIDVVGWSQYFPTASAKSYLWSSVVAGGGLTHSDGVGSSDGFALYNVNVVFAMFSGSYYGDWDNESNFQRAALGANGSILVSVYSAQPQWICHTMALGETIGDVTKITQENGVDGIYVPHNRGAGQVHIALHGDPTLRAHPLPAPTNLRASTQGGSLILSWDSGAAEGLAGYIVYQEDTSTGSYRQLTATPLQETSYSVSDAKKCYMVKAVAVTTSPSGSYWNSSQGVFYPDPLEASAAGAPAPPRDLVVASLGAGEVFLRWVSGSFEHTAFEIERRVLDSGNFVKVATVGRDQFDYRDSSVTGEGWYEYRVRSVNAAGVSGYSNHVRVSTRMAWVEYVGDDRIIQGRWIGAYGSDGYIIPGIADNLPAGSTMTVSNASPFITTPVDDVRALQIPGTEGRSANIWNHSMPFAFHLNFPDDRVHQVAFYLMSYSRNTEWVDVEVFDAVTKHLFDKRKVESLGDGVYLKYNVSRQVIIRVTPPGWWAHGQVYGFFFDAPKLQPVQIQPQSGTFSGKMEVRMSTASTQAEIRHTLDGSEPTIESARYTGSFWIYENAKVRARAFRENYPPSEIAEATFTNSVENQFGFIRWDETQGGDWVQKFGQDGYWVASGAKKLPSYAELNGMPEPPWVWSDSANEARAPWKDVSASRKVASAWHGNELLLEFGVFDTRRRAVALYFMDWDRQNRVQQVEVLDLRGIVRDSYQVDNFAEGKYLVFGLKGYTKVRIKKVAGPNVVLNGIFFDPAPIQVNVGSPVPLTNPVLSGGGMSITVTGPPEQRFCLDRSDNLRDWTCFSTNAISAPQFQLLVPFEDKEKVRFFRGHIVP